MSAAYFRIGFPKYKKDSIFRDKVEIVIDRKGSVLGATNLDKLSSLNIPPFAEELSLVDIAPNAFINAKSLTTVAIAEGIEEIGENAFKNCIELKTIALPESIYMLGSSAFENCKSLKQITLPSDLESIPPRLFYSCHSLSNLIIPSSVKAIGTMAFASTHSLRSIVLPSPLEEISDGLFMDSAIEIIEIPHSVKRIGGAAFSRAKNLRTIYYNGTLEEFRRIEFGLHWNSNINEDIAFFVRDEKGSYYNAFKKEEKEEVRVEVDEREVRALEALGLNRNANRDAIIKAFRERAKRFHPDILSGKDLDPEFTEFAAKRFRELQEAEEYLLSKLSH